jgi:hypothetical protein
MCTYMIEWKGRVFSGHRPTPEATLRARLDKIQELAESDPKRRSVLVRGD